MTHFLKVVAQNQNDGQLHSTWRACWNMLWSESLNIA